MKTTLVLFLLFSSSLFSADLAKKVLLVTTLSENSVQELIADSSYASNVKTLISHLEDEINRQLSQTGIDKQNPRAIAALFLTHNVLNLNTALYAAADAANYDIHTVRDAAANSVLNEALHPDWKAAAYAAKSAAKSVGKQHCENAWYDARSAAKNAIGKAALVALSNFNHIKMDPVRCRIATLYVLAFIAQENFLREYFIATYHHIFAALYNIDNALFSNQQHIRSIIAHSMWNNPHNAKLANNPFVLSLKALLTDEKIIRSSL